MQTFKGFLSEARVDTTLNASITELFPAIAFNLKYKPRSVEDFKKFLYGLYEDFLWRLQGCQQGLFGFFMEL